VYGEGGKEFLSKEKRATYYARGRRGRRECPAVTVLPRIGRE